MSGAAGLIGWNTTGLTRNGGLGLSGLGAFASSGVAVALVNGATTSSRLAFTRASKAWDVDGAGNLTEFPIDTARNGQTLVNLNTNPRGDFAVAPTFPQATQPIGWAGTQNGLTPSVVGAGSTNGIAWVDYRFQGTPTTTGAQTLFPQNTFAAPNGDTYSTSVYLALVGGTLTNVSASFLVRVSGEAGSTSVTPDATFTRYTNTRTLTLGSANSTVRWVYTDTVTPVDFTLRVGGWQLEKGASVTALTLPPVGTQRTSFRDATSPPGTLLEGATSNTVPNPRGEGATGATPPTGWALSATRGLTHTFTPATVNGVPGVTWRMVGTPNSTSGTGLDFEVDTVSTAGQLCTLSVYHQLVSGTYANTTMALRQAGEAVGGQTTFTPGATLTRITNTTTAVGTSYRCRISFAFTDTVTAVDFTVFFGAPMREMAVAVATSPFFPVIGAPAASTRATDALQMTGTDYTALFGNGAPRGWIILDVNIPATLTLASTLLEISDGTYNNRVFVYSPAASAQVQAVRFLAGASTFGSLAAGNVRTGVAARVGLRWSPAGGIDLSVNGGTIVNIAGATPATTRLQLGNLFDLSLPLAGRIAGAWVGNTARSDADFLFATTPGENPLASPGQVDFSSPGNSGLFFLIVS